MLERPTTGVEKLLWLGTAGSVPRHVASIVERVAAFAM